MSIIKIMSLGGLQENGKNLYVVDINDRLFILDAGLKYPTAELYGVDMVIPDISYLVENNKKIAGIFLTHAHDNNMGSVFAILKEFKCNVYASKFTLCLLKENLKENDLNPDNFKMIEVSARSKVLFDNLSVRFFEVAHNTFDCLCIVLGTPDGNIIYTGNYTFDQNAKINYVLMYSNLSKFAKEGVLALLTESVGATSANNRGNILELTLRIKKLFDSATGRILFTLYSSDLLKFQQIAELALSYGKKIAISGRRAQNIINKAINLGYLKIPAASLINLRNINDKNHEDKDLVIFIAGEREEPFFALQRMSKGFDKFIQIKEEDTLSMLTPSSLGIEKIISQTLDMVYRLTSNVTTYSSELLQVSHANREEIKQMINLTKPKYIIPISGEYRHQYSVRTIANCIDYTDDKVIIPDLGDILYFENTEYKGVTETCPTGEILIDGKAVGDIGDVVLRDREVLATDGVLIIIVCVNTKTKKLACDVQLDTRGFIFFDQSEDLLKGITLQVEKISTEYLKNKYVNWVDYRNDVRSDINKYIYKKTRRAPMIIPTLIAIDN